jgi:hypothetical protein
MIEDWICDLNAIIMFIAGILLGLFIWFLYNLNKDEEARRSQNDKCK